MTNDLALWEKKFGDRFQNDEGEAFQEADRLSYSFDNGNTLTLLNYIGGKIRLYNEAGDYDEDSQVRRIKLGLDLIHDDNSLTVVAGRIWSNNPSSGETHHGYCSK
ncbi:hypothetical protein F4677DRAFT_404306 [Hypoxylon crocopeplum]|nr:hypothetical protein F4677DRAFT_404306 [Hypoxylon crocopeplum]